MNERYVIHVTKLCNLDCKYCYESDTTSTYTTDEIIDFCHNIVINNKDKEFGIEFLGGEPMLGWNNIVAAYNYLEKFNKITDYVITTNGTILTDEQLEFFKRNTKIYYAVSMDGVKWANQFRVFKNSGINSYETVVNNLKKFLKEIGPQRCSVHIVAHHYNVANLYDSIMYLYNLGIKNIGIGTIESTRQIDRAYCDRFISELNKVSKEIVNNNLDLYVDVLESLKPKSDTRIYIKDNNGRVLGESYGRSHNDITEQDTYNSIKTTSPVEETIYTIRLLVYSNHQILRGKNGR